jgi:hypothetical protein
MRASPQLIVLFVLSLLAAPPAAKAQQPAKLPRIGPAHLDSTMLQYHWREVPDRARTNEIPAMGELREFPAIGGLRALSLEVVANLKTAKALGLTLPPSLLLRAEK